MARRQLQAIHFLSLLPGILKNNCISLNRRAAPVPHLSGGSAGGNKFWHGWGTPQELQKREGWEGLNSAAPQGWEIGRYSARLNPFWRYETRKSQGKKSKWIYSIHSMLDWVASHQNERRTHADHMYWTYRIEYITERQFSFSLCFYALNCNRNRINNVILIANF